jgi:F-type H+-transporting ATPase subunit gamma
MRLRIRSVKSIAQVTKALETVSASKVRRSVAATTATRPYAEKAWKVLVHLARTPGHGSLHPLLKERETIKKVLVVLISTDGGLAGSLNVNIVRKALQHFRDSSFEVSYITVGRKGRDMLVRRGYNILAEFSNIPPAPTFMDVSAIGHIVVDEFLKGDCDQVYVVYTRFISMVKQEPVVRKLLPLVVEYSDQGDEPENITHHRTTSVFTFEPDEGKILDQIIPRFTELQIYQAILSAQASEHAARMMAMHSATDNARELITALQLDYNKARQQTITNDMLDIASGAEALAKVTAARE